MAHHPARAVRQLSTIIPTHDRPEVLRQCLESLQAQDIDASLVEVIVVDDGSSSDVGAVVAAAAARGPVSIRCERQELAGLNTARNRGAKASDGEILAFLDDDTLVSPGWARALLRAFEQQGCAGVGGRVELRMAGPAPIWLAGEQDQLLHPGGELGAGRDYLAEFDLGAEPRWLDDHTFPVGANCAVRRSAFDRIGGFHAGLDRLGQSLVSNGDLEFFRRLRAGGGKLRYEPSAHVFHCVPAERLTLRYFLRRLYAQGVSDELLLTLRGVPPTWKHRARLLERLGRAGPILARDLLRRRGAVDARLWASYWRGRLSAVGKTPSVADESPA